MPAVIMPLASSPISNPNLNQLVEMVLTIENGRYCFHEMDDQLPRHEFVIKNKLALPLLNNASVESRIVPHSARFCYIVLDSAR